MVSPIDQLRQDASRIFQHAIRAVDPADLVNCSLHRYGNELETVGGAYDLSKYRHVYVAGAGKASALMAGGLEHILGEHISAGIVIVKYGHSVSLKKIRLVEAGHPVPDRNGLDATREILDLLRRASAEDLVISPLSGGASALLVAPADDLTLEDKQITTRLLLECGADIRAINTIRKHISGVKGGRLAQCAYPAAFLALILSDVIGDPIDTIASGPTAPDSTTFADCVNILSSYSLLDRIPARVRTLLERGANHEVPDTPKVADAVFQKVHNVIVGNNRMAVAAAEQCARELGYSPVVLADPIHGEARQAAIDHVSRIKEITSSENAATCPVCIVSGGETTVTIGGSGRGGRNQEFALAAAIAIEGEDGIAVLSAGTDGTDGPTEAAGAVVDGMTVSRGKNRGLDPLGCLENNDSYRFLQAADDLLVTGPTLTNVMDLQLVLIA